MSPVVKPIKGTETLKKIVDHTNEFTRRVSKGRQLPERLWFSSILMARGFHWISFENTRGTFVKSNNRRAIPRPVTNKYAECGTTLVSNLINFDPRSTYAPQTGNPDDMHSAIAANQIIKAIENEVLWQEVKAEEFPWLVYTGNVFKVFGFDRDGGKVKEYRPMVCLNSQYGGECDYREDVDANAPMEDLECPKCAEDGIRQQLVDDPAAMGETVMKPSGCMTCEVVNPFELFWDYSLSSFDKTPMAVRIHPKSVQWVKDEYNKDVPTASVRRQELNARFRAGLNNLIPTGEEAPTEQVDIVEAWCKPCRKFPKGFYLVMLPEGTVLECTTYPWITKEGKVFLPIVHTQYERTPGSGYGRTPLFDAMEKQRMRNRLESMEEMYYSRVANPVWLIPHGTQDSPTGHIGQEIKFDAHATNGQVPHRDAPPPPPPFAEAKERLDMEMYKLCGIPEITRGERPLSIKTGFGMEKLEQAAKARSSPVFMNVSIAAAKAQMIMLEIFRMENPPERYMRVFGQAAGWTIKKIEQLDLQGGVDIWVEPGGSQPKTPLERQAQLDLFMSAGLLDVTDPMVRWRIFMLYGMDNLMPDTDADLMQIAREQDRYMNAPEQDPNGPYTPTLRRMPYDNDMLHYQQHAQLMKSEAFETYSELKKQELMLHQSEHEMALMQQMAAQQQQQQSQGAPSEKGGKSNG